MSSINKKCDHFKKGIIILLYYQQSISNPSSYAPSITTQNNGKDQINNQSIV